MGCRLPGAARPRTSRSCSGAKPKQAAPAVLLVAVCLDELIPDLNPVPGGPRARRTALCHAADGPGRCLPAATSASLGLKPSESRESAPAPACAPAALLSRYACCAPLGPRNPLEPPYFRIRRHTLPPAWPESFFYLPSRLARRMPLRCCHGGATVVPRCGSHVGSEISFVCRPLVAVGAFRMAPSALSAHWF